MKNIIFYVKEVGMLPYTAEKLLKKLNNHNLHLIHTTKLNGKKSTDFDISESFQSKIDFSYQSINDIFLLLKKEKAVFISYGHNSLIELSLGLLGNIFGIKTIYIQHGLYIEKNKFFINDFKIVLKKYINYLILFIFTMRYDYKYCFKNIYYFLLNKTEFSPCKLNLFFDEDSLNLLNTYGEKVIIGHPSSLVTNHMNNKKIDFSVVSYIQQGFLAMGISNITRKEEKKFFNKLFQHLKKLGFETIQFFKHPRELSKNYIYLQSNEEISFFTSQSEHSNLLHSGLVLGHYSTLLKQCKNIGLYTIEIAFPGITNNEYRLSSYLKLLNEKLYESVKKKENITISNKYISWDIFAQKICKQI
ncbi:MAG: hypothetical protein CMG60_00730 [Candidatus Marinimicrobia bacterium]|nr:hypothetical protein [Candidatus Neomarinimicrobiota bacterium]|tara:strand:- start:5659 stop:6738 length:1080 start_codon:yes stop_codon:yes gene_type:complete